VAASGGLMNKTNRWLALCALVVAGALLACKKSNPEAVCKHMIDLAQKDGKYKDKDEAKDQYEDCLEDVEKIKNKLGDEKFKKFAKCVLDKDDFDAARKKCDPDDFE
jgi:hypothetical protein